MNTRAAALITLLDLSPHPEGGYFREVYRSASTVQPADGRTDRPALTTIYFLLAAGDVSRWHRVASDEVWHYYEGDALDLLVADEHLDSVSRRVLGPVGTDASPVHVVPAGRWQAARSVGAFTLVGCTVGPGFDFADFELIDPNGTEAARVRARHADAVPFL